MRRTIYILCVLGALILGSSVAMAQASEAHSGLAEFKKVSSAIACFNDAFSIDNVRFQSLRISPVIKTEKWLEIPFETAISAPADQILKALRKIDSYDEDGDKIVNLAANVSVSAETQKDGAPILTITLLSKLYTGSFPEDSKLVNRGKKLIQVFDAVLKNTCFTPQIKRGIGKAEKTAENNWLTNLRIDSDQRVQMTGYAFDLNSISGLGEALYKSENLKDVSINNATKNVYEKVPVWRFDMTGRAK